MKMIESVSMSYCFFCIIKEYFGDIFMCGFRGGRDDFDFFFFIFGKVYISEIIVNWFWIFFLFW